MSKVFHVNQERLFCNILSWYAVISVCLLQFVVIPFFADMDQVGKGLSGAVLVLMFLIVLVVKIRKIYFSAVWGWFFLACAGLVLSASFAIAPYEAWISTGFLGLLIIFGVGITHLASLDDRFIDRFVDGLIFSGVLASILGVYEYARYSLFGTSGNMIIPFLLPPDANPRIGGMYGQPNLFALFLTLVLLGFVYRYVHRPCQVRYLALLRFVPVALVAMVFSLTGSRGGILSFVLTFLVLAWLVARGKYLCGEKDKKREFLLLYVAIGVGYVFGLGVYSGWLSPVGPELDIGATHKIASVSGYDTDSRFLFWSTAIAIFLDHPWLGIGLDNFKMVMASYRLKAHGMVGFIDYETFAYSKWAHNEFLQLLCEGGGIAGFFVLVLLIYLFIGFCRKNLREGNPSRPELLYSHIFLLPFVLQSMLGWHLRHASLIFLFFCILGILFSQYRKSVIRVRALLKPPLIILACVVFVFLLSLISQEIGFGSFSRGLSNSERFKEQIAGLESFKHPFVELRALKKAVPVLTGRAMLSKDVTDVERLLSLMKRLVALHEHENHWFNLARIHLRLGDLEQAKLAVQNSIALRPSFGYAFELEHYLNMLTAAEKTGRPLEEFYPHPPNGTYEVPELFHVAD